MIPANLQRQADAQTRIGIEEIHKLLILYPDIVHADIEINSTRPNPVPMACCA